MQERARAIIEAKPSLMALSRTDGPRYSARQHLVHLHDRFDLRVIGDVAQYLRAMFGERFLKILKRFELEIGDGEIGRLVTGRIRHALDALFVAPMSSQA